jgi:hypothetical protein
MDREQKEYTALREMGINVDDSLRLTKFIQHDTTNSKYKSLAQTIFTTPNMTLSRATFLFETYHPGEQPPPAEPSALSVNAIFCNYCRKHGHKTKACKKKTSDEKKRKTSSGSSEHVSDESTRKQQKFSCCICKAKDHRAHECPRMPEVRKCLADSDCKKPAWGHDEPSDDEDA